ncbi:MAG: energy-coupling factor transporter transmembrane component T [Candidatus Jordarchaeales archaeon]
MLRLFDYKSKDSVLHKLDPRVKIYIFGVFVVTALLSENIFLLCIIQIVLLALLRFAQVINDFFKQLKGFFYLIFLITIIDTVLFSLKFALLMVLKFLTIIFSFSLLLSITPPDEIIQVAERVKLPIEFVIAFSIALRYIPVMIREAELIFDSQKARGVSFQEGNIIDKLRGYIYLLIPLIATTIRRALHVAESMEARGFGAKERRTNLHELKMREKDCAAVAVATLALITITLLRFYFAYPV